jgi:hypothetical protein
MWLFDNILYCLVVGGMFWWSGYLAYSPNVRRDHIPALRLSMGHRTYTKQGRKNWQSVSRQSLINALLFLLVTCGAYFLIWSGVSLEAMCVIPFFCLIVVFSRVVHMEKFVPSLYPNVLVALGVTVVWVLSDHWLVLDAVAFMSTVAFVVLFRKVQTAYIMIAVIVAILGDVYTVYGPYQVMANIASHAENTPYLVTAPDTKVAVSLLGLGDFAFSNLLVMVAFRESNRYATQTFWIASIVGFFIGLAIGVEASTVTNHAQPGTAYLLGTIMLTLIMSAKWCRIPVWNVLWGSKDSV